MKKLLIILALFISGTIYSQAYHPKGAIFETIVGGDPAYLEVSGKSAIYFNGTIFRKWNGTAWSDFTASTSSFIYEDELTDAENNIDVGFNLESTTLVYFNGKIVPNTLWSGEGTQILNVSLDTKQYDKLTVRN